MRNASPQPALLRFTPVYKPYVWGGTDLPLRLGRRDAPPLARYAESWELADHPDGMSVVEGGPCAGRTLHSLVEQFGAALTGGPSDAFPLLVKILDAADRLSVQVHPDEEAARRHGGEAKTECWYILDAAPGAAVWAGLRPGVTPTAFRRALETGAVPDLLASVPVTKGDLLFIPGGLVHAIGPGCLILEVQQRSNTTYRVFDWNRAGAGGAPRPLHVREALETIRWNGAEGGATAPRTLLETAAARIDLRLRCPFFEVEEIALRGPLEARTGDAGFHALFTVSGALRIAAGSVEERLPEGRTGLLPAWTGAYGLSPEGAEARVLRLSLPAR